MNICTVLDPGGAPSSTAAMGVSKTVSVDTPFTGIIIIEAKCGALWVPVPGLNFQAPGTKTIDALFQEVRVAGAPSGAPSISISADDSGGQFVDLPFAGTAVDTDLLGSENTILVAGLPSGDLLKVETSDDSVNWAEACTFQADGLKNIEVTACWMRVVYSGSGAPSICVGAATVGGNALITPTVRWVQGAPSDKLVGNAFGGEFYEAYDECIRLFDLGFPRVDLRVSSEYSPHTATYDPGGPDEFTEKVSLVNVRPGDASTIFDMRAIGVESDDGPNLINFADDAQWTAPVAFGGENLVLFITSTVTPAVILDGRGPTFWLQGKVSTWIATALTQPAFKGAGADFIGFFEDFGSHTDWKLGFEETPPGSGGPMLAPILDLNGGLLVVRTKGNFAVSNSLMDSAGGGLLIWESERADAGMNWHQPGLAGSTVVVDGRNAAGSRAAQPGRPILNLVGPITHDATIEYGLTYYCDTTGVAGSPDAAFAFAAPDVTLTDSTADFGANLVGESVTIAGATTAANNGTFPITAVTPTTLVYTNAAGVAEAEGAATYSIDGDVYIDPLPSAAIGQGESFHAKNVAGAGVVNLVPAAGEAVDTASLAAGAAGRFESDGSTIAGSSGRWVAI